MNYVVLLRGINVGGKNKIPMAELKRVLEGAKYTNVTTYIQSGNVVLTSEQSAAQVARTIESLLVHSFALDSTIVRTLVLERDEYERVVKDAPEGFGDHPEQFRYDVLFGMGVSADDIMKHVRLKDVIDRAWPGNCAVYFRRPSLDSPDATKSHLNKIIQSPIYGFVTIRNWNTTRRLLEMVSALD